MQVADEPERRVRDLRNPQRAVGAALALVVEEHPEPALGVEQRLELLDGPAHARTDGAGRDGRRDPVPIEIVNVDDGGTGGGAGAGASASAGAGVFGLRWNTGSAAGP